MGLSGGWHGGHLLKKKKEIQIVGDALSVSRKSDHYRGCSRADYLKKYFQLIFTSEHLLNIKKQFINLKYLNSYLKTQNQT